MRKRHVWSCGHERWYVARNNRAVRHDEVCQACRAKMERAEVMVKGLFTKLAELEATIAMLIAQQGRLSQLPQGWRERTRQ